MKKKELEVGMRVKYRNGGIGVFLRSKEYGLVFVSSKEWIKFLTISDDLTQEWKGDSFDIVAVYQQPPVHDLMDETKVGDLLWERQPEPKEMSVKEIEKELGYPVKVVAEEEPKVVIKPSPFASPISYSP